MAYLRRQRDLPTGQEYLKSISEHPHFADHPDHYNSILRRVQLWAAFEANECETNEDSIKEVLQIVAWLEGDVDLIRDLNCILPHGIAIFCSTVPEETVPEETYITLLTKQSGDILPNKPSGIATNGAPEFDVVFCTEDLRAAIPNNIDWDYVVKASKFQRWTSCLLDLVTREIDDTSLNLEYRRVAFRRQTALAKEDGQMPAHLLLTGKRLTRQDGVESDRNTKLSSFAERWKGNMGNLTVCLRVPERIVNSNEYHKEQEYRQYAKNVLREVLTWYRLKHPNILPFWGVNKGGKGTASRWAVVVPWMNQGNLIDYINKNPLDMNFKLRAIHNILEGLYYLHNYKPSIWHESLKARYILLDDNLNCYISHFACASIEGPDKTGTRTQTSSFDPCWRPPECRGQPLDKSRSKGAVDIYSFGCVVAEIYTGKRPFHGVELEQVKTFDQPYLPPTVPLKIEQWTRECWHTDPELRPTAARLREEIVPVSRRYEEKGEGHTRLLPPELLNWVDRELQVRRAEHGLKDSQPDLLDPNLPQISRIPKGANDSAQNRVNKAWRLRHIIDVARKQEKEERRLKKEQEEKEARERAEKEAQERERKEAQERERKEAQERERKEAQEREVATLTGA